jgi:hypothetical protein
MIKEYEFPDTVVGNCMSYTIFTALKNVSTGLWLQVMSFGFIFRTSHTIFYRLRILHPNG